MFATRRKLVAQQQLSLSLLMIEKRTFSEAVVVVVMMMAHTGWEIWNCTGSVCIWSVPVQAVPRALV